ncbi:MAG: DUF3291 domain-containing protein [Henriciella sp.]|nr:DUF3291 domain-containing protein [Henriciella sp.]
MQLAELNVGRLIAPTDDPRVKTFMDNLDAINGIGKRMPGFVWMMDGLAEPGSVNEDIVIEDDPLLVPNLSVWKDVESLERFVWGTVHKKFYDRRAEWFEVLGEMHFVMWWVPDGHRPSLAEALQKLARLRAHGESEEAFGWDWVRDARQRRTQAG